VFADYDALAVFTRLHLDLPLASIVERTAIPAAILRLIEHAEAVGLVQLLVAQLAATYGGNASIAAIAARFGVPVAPSAPPRAPGAAASSAPPVATSSTPPAPCTLPPYEDVRFVGRVKELAALHAWGAGDRRVLVLHGPPGVGKTRLAVEWAQGQAAAFPGGRYFLSFRADPHGALHEVARLRGVRREPDERLDEWAIRTLHHLGAERALVIFDDLQSAAEFTVWFGHLSTARAIVVTNERVWPAGYERLPVEVLAVDDARTLARNVIGNDPVAARHVEDIVARASSNAVQIVVDAGAVHEAVELGDSPSLPPVPAPEALESFERAWRTATDDARALVCALALYRAQGTPTARVAEVLGADGWEEARTRKASSEAVRRHLVARDAEALTLHPLLRTFARAKGAEVLTTAAQEAHARAFVARAQAFAETPGDRAKFAEVAHDEFDLAVWDARPVVFSPDDRMKVGDALTQAGRFAEARDWYEHAADEKRQGDLHGRVDHNSLGMTLHQMGHCLSSLGRFAEARGWYERAADEKRQGDLHGRVDHQSLGLTLHQVGHCLSSLGQFAEARGWYERAADEMRQGDVHGRVDHAALGWTTYRAALCIAEAEQLAEARDRFALAIGEMRQGNIFGGVDASRLATCLEALANTLDRLGLADEARAPREEAAQLRASLPKP
jgi:tetratricopeptide (TPR) repeat protein